MPGKACLRCGYGPSVSSAWLVCCPCGLQVIFGGARWRHVSEELKGLLCGLLAKDPAKRLTAEQAMRVRPGGRR